MFVFRYFLMARRAGAAAFALAAVCTVSAAAQQGVAQACPAGSLACPPRQSVRSLAVQISGVSASDAALLRSLRSQVRLRNDTVTGACPA